MSDLSSAAGFDHTSHSSSDNLSVDVTIAVADEVDEPPSEQELSFWAMQAYKSSAPAQFLEHAVEISIRLVTEAEMAEYNVQYRGKQGATNVLSFGIDDDLLDSDTTALVPLLGDIVICHPVVVSEAVNQEKLLRDHYAHMVVHGVLHLCGFDHQIEADANAMEARECQILGALGVADPYQ